VQCVAPRSPALMTTAPSASCTAYLGNIGALITLISFPFLVIAVASIDSIHFPPHPPLLRVDSVVRDCHGLLSRPTL
jgi:hypothetical protein